MASDVCCAALAILLSGCGRLHQNALRVGLFALLVEINVPGSWVMAPPSENTNGVHRIEQAAEKHAMTYVYSA